LPSAARYVAPVPATAGSRQRSTSTASERRGGHGLPRLLLLTPDFPPAHGGIQLMAERFAAGLHGFSTTVLTPSAGGARELDRASGLSVRRVRAPSGRAAVRNLALNAAALPAALARRPAATLSLHLVTSPAAAAVRALTGAPTVQYFHAKEIGGRPRLAAFAADRADAVVAVSAYTAELVAATGAQPRRLELIPPGVDLPRVTGPLAAERPTVLTVARLSDSYKGHDVMLGALARVRREVPDVEWVVIGDGPLRGELEALARAEGVADAVRFLGAVDDATRDEWFRRTDVFAMPSRLPGAQLAGEGFGIVYLEAGTYGKPVLAGNVAGALDSVRDGETGLLVDPTDADAVGAALARLLRDPQLAGRLGRGGAQRAEQLSWAQVAARLEAVLLSLI
jgi:phosphatidylinositol alpha-1,6-mannosyltransferase